MLASKQLQVQYLLQIHDNQGKRTVPLEPTPHSIGRGANNSIVLHCSQISRQHAMLLPVTNPNNAAYSFRLVDGNSEGKLSTNGVFINGQCCFSHDLKHGDMVKFSQKCGATYYERAQSSDFEELGSPATKIHSSISSDSSNSSKTLIDPIIQPDTSLESALMRLASFPDLLSNPIIEMTLSGTITYLNLGAVEHFPDILELKSQHVILAGLLSAFESEPDKFFVRQVEYSSRIYKQSACYSTETRLLRTYILDITQHQQKTDKLSKLL